MTGSQPVAPRPPESAVTRTVGSAVPPGRARPRRGAQVCLGRTRSSQPPGTPLGDRRPPLTGIQIWPTAMSPGSAIRLGASDARCCREVTVPVHHQCPHRRSWRAAERRATGSASEPGEMRRSSTSSEHTRAAISTRASSAGCSPRLGPLTSTMPSVRPVHGSVIGAAAQPHRACDSTKCSAPLMKNRLAEDQGGADRVGPDVALGPGRTLDELDVVGHPVHGAPGVAAAPEHPTLGVGDHHELARVDDRCEQLHEPGHHRRRARSGHACAPAR